MTTALPLKNKSGYLHYCSDVRSTIVKSNEGIKSVDIVKKMGEGWRALSDGEKQKYEKRAVDDKERYLKDKDEWNASNPGIVIEKKVKAKRTKKQDAPAAEEEIVILDEELVQEEPVVAVKVPAGKKKAVAVAAAVEPVAAAAEPVAEKKARAPNKFQNFCKLERPKLKVSKPQLQPKEVLIELGALWKALSTQEQDKFI